MRSRSSAEVVRPPALRAGDRVAIVAPASPFAPEELDAGKAELRRLGFEPVHTDAVYARDGYVAGPAEARARDLRAAWTDPSVAAIVAARGGYGSVHLLPFLRAQTFRESPKALIGFSDITSLQTWLLQDCGVVPFHGPMIERRLAHGRAAYDEDSFVRCLCRAEPLGEIAPPQLDVITPGEAVGELVGGTLTQLVSSLGTPYAFDPPAGCVLFLDEVAERPYRLDRLLTQLRLSGLLVRAAAIVCNDMPRCSDPGENAAARDVVRRVLGDFPGPILFGLPAGHTDGPIVTLPFGVRARVLAGSRPALVIEEAAVS